MVGQASRSNGALGGRPRGTIKTAAEKAAAKRARPSLQEAAQRNELELLEILERIARDEKQPQTHASRRFWWSSIVAVASQSRLSLAKSL